MGTDPKIVVRGLVPEPGGLWTKPCVVMPELKPSRFADAVAVLHERDANMLLPSDGQRHIHVARKCWRCRGSLTSPQGNVRFTDGDADAIQKPRAPSYVFWLVSMNQPVLPGHGFEFRSLPAPLREHDAHLTTTHWLSLVPEKSDCPGPGLFQLSAQHDVVWYGPCRTWLNFAGPVRLKRSSEHTVESGRLPPPPGVFFIVLCSYILSPPSYLDCPFPVLFLNFTLLSCPSPQWSSAYIQLWALCADCSPSVSPYLLW